MPNRPRTNESPHDAVQKRILAQFGDNQLEERRQRLCRHCAYLSPEYSRRKGVYVYCEKGLLPLAQDGNDCVYFTEAKPEVPFAPED